MLAGLWRYYSNVAIADTLAVPGGGNLSNAATSLYAGSGAPQGYPTQYPWILRLEPGTSNEELVLVSAGTGTSASPWTVSRAQDGTTAKAHNAGVAIQHGLSAGDLSQAATHYGQGSGSGVHGLPASAWLTGAFATIYETLTTGGQQTVSWSNIPQTYAHLLVVAQGRLAETTVQSDDVQVQFNGDAGNDYSYLTNLLDNPGGTMTGPSAGTGYSNASAPMFRFLASQSGGAADAGGGFAVIPNYAGSSFTKTFYGMSGGGNGTSSFVDLRARVGIWAPAVQAGITAITLTAPSGGFLANSYFGLYGFG
jgi:hypothetical protein